MAIQGISTDFRARFEAFLGDVDFPISKEELLEKYGEESFRCEEKNMEMTLAQCLEDVSKGEFRSVSELSTAIRDAVSENGGGTPQEGGDEKEDDDDDDEKDDDKKENDVDKDKDDDEDEKE